MRRGARRLCLSDSVVGESLPGAAVPDLRAVAQIASRQPEARAQNAPERRMRKARLPAVKPLGGHDFSQVAFPEGYGGAGLGSLALVDAGRDLASHGRTGRGKAHPATAVGIATVSAGKSARLFTAAQLAMHLAEAKGQGRPKKAPEGLGSVGLLVIDEPGYVPPGVDGARLLFRVMSAAETGQSMVVTTNTESSKWGTVLGDDEVASAIVDGLVYAGRLVGSDGTGYRMGNALMLGKGAGSQPAREGMPLRGVSKFDRGFCRLLLDGIHWAPTR